MTPRVRLFITNTSSCMYVIIFIRRSWIISIITLCRILFPWMTIYMYDFFLYTFLSHVYSGLNQLFSGFIFFHNTNSISPSYNIATFEFQCFYMNCSRSMPGLWDLSGNRYIRYATNVRIWALFPYLLKIYFHWQIPLIQIHYGSKCCSSWSQYFSKPYWPASKFTQCMTLEAKVITRDELIWLCEIKFTYMKFLDKILGLLVHLNNKRQNM